MLFRSAGKDAPAEQERPPPVVDSPTTPVSAPKTGPVRVQVIRKEVQEALPEETPAIEVELVDPEPADDVEPGVLSIGSIQSGAEVYIQGQFVRQVPVRKSLEPGRYVIGIIAPDGRAKRFVVNVEAGEKYRQVWDFDRGEWR